MGPVDEDFARLIGRLDYSMLIVTATHGNDRDGCLIGFATQVSIQPARFLVCLSVKNRTYRLAAQAATLVIHPVPEDAEDLAVLFGGETGDEVDKFARCRWEPGPDGTPVLSDVDSWFAGRGSATSGSVTTSGSCSSRLSSTCRTPTTRSRSAVAGPSSPVTSHSRRGSAPGVSGSTTPCDRPAMGHPPGSSCW